MTQNNPKNPTSTAKRVWGRAWFGSTAVVAAGAACGAAVGYVLPRGPMSSPSGLVLMATALFLGVVAGLVIRKRRGLLLVAVSYFGAIELVRLPVDGPSVDGIHLGSIYGVIAFVTGRGFEGLLFLVPAVVGVLYGTGASRRFAATPALPSRTPVIRRIGAAGLAIAMLAGFYVVAQPARTDQIAGSDGKVLSGSIAELGTAEVDGHETSVMLRGKSTKSPILVYLAGGPGGTDLGSMRLFGERLEEDFLVATWDQRGAGTSYGALDPTSTLTVDQLVDDTIELVEQLRARFDQDKIYLVGNSWGTILGVLAVQKRPDLFAAYVGAGQMANLPETDRLIYQDTLAWAKDNGREGLVSSLEEDGPPPYQDVYKYEAVLSHEHDWNDYEMAPAYARSGELPANLFVPEYDLVQKFRGMASFLDTFAALYPKLQEIDFRTQVTSLEVPVYLVEGVSEARGRLEPAHQWFDVLDAPQKRWIDIPNAGHRAMFEQPARFAEVMKTIRAENE